jgi:dolichol kinase
MSEAIALTQAVTAERRRTADRVFRGALAYTAALSLLWVFFLSTGQTFGLFNTYTVDREALLRVFSGFLFFSVLWGVIWYGVKSLVLRAFVGFTKEERRLAFRSRMSEPFDLSGLLARHSERRIRIADMIGRRGRFLTLQFAFYSFLYAQIAKDPKPAFLGMGLQDGLFDAVVLSWVTLALYYSNGFVARAFWGAQSRIMDGSLARANCLLITTLWSAFKFVMVPIGARLAVLFPPSSYAALFVFIWGSYAAADHSSEIVGSLFGKQKLRVWGMGDLNRKSVAGTVAAFVASLGLCLFTVQTLHLPVSWIALAVLVSVSNTFVELFSPRGTDDFTMATANALLCWAFGALSFAG